jgi:regulator of RNase E activity RraA
MSGGIHLLSGKWLSGPAVTIQLKYEEGASTMDAGLATVRLLEEAPAGSVIVAVLDGDKAFAPFGSTLAALAKTRRLAGFVVDGSVRDLRDLAKMAFPVFAVGTVSGSAGGHYKIGGINVAVRCGGIDVAPGDSIFGDEDGIAVAPREQSEQIVALARKLQSQKQALLPLIERHGSYMRALQEQRASEKRPE